MLFLYRLLYSLSSVTLLLPIYVFNRKVDIAQWFAIESHQPLYNWIFYILLLALPFVLTFLLLRFADNLQHQQLTDSKIKTVQSAGADQFPIALGYIFIALSINNNYALALSFLILLLVCFNTPAYFNLCMYVFRYKYYYVTTNDNIRVLVATRHRILLGTRPSFTKLRRINDLTYIDIEHE